MAAPICDTNPAYTYLVRVTKSPPDKYTGIFIYTDPPVGSGAASKIVSSFSFTGKHTFCFKQDPASTAPSLVIGIENCPACTPPATWSGGILFVDVTAPGIGSDGGALLLQAMSGPTLYKASNNPVIDGGRPIIRNQLDPGLILVIVAIALIVGYLGYLATKWLMNREAAP